MPKSHRLRDIRSRANALVKNALGTPAGEALLADLERRYVDIELYHSAHARMAYEIGRRDIVILLRRQLTEELDDE